jgi:hypothetical protein
MTVKQFVKKNLGKRCYVNSPDRRYGRVAGFCSKYNTVVVEFEPYPEPGKVGQTQEWPMDRITIVPHE